MTLPKGLGPKKSFLTGFGPKWDSIAVLARETGLKWAKMAEWGLKRVKTCHKMA